MYTSRFYLKFTVALASLAFTSTLCAQGAKVIPGQAVPKGETPKPVEEKIREALDKQCQKVEFVETPLGEVADQLGDAFEINIEVDTRGLDLVGIGSDTPVTRTLNGISLRSVLRLILRELELTYFVQDEVLMITTPEEAETNQWTRIYEVRDLVFRASPQRSVVHSAWDETAADFDSLIKVITTTTAPESWDEVGGPGSIEGIHYADKFVLIVTQTEDTHERIQKTLESLRNVEPVVAPNKTTRKLESKPNEVYVKLYPLINLDSTDESEVADLVREVLGEEIWDKTRGTFLLGKAKALAVKHDQHTHSQVREILLGINAILPEEISGGSAQSGFHGHPNSFPSPTTSQ